MNDQHMPPLGPEREAPRICHRYTGAREDGSWIPCGSPAAIHVLWTPDYRHSFICAAHRYEAITRWRWHRYHELGACCGMPGALYFPAENVCRYAGGLPVHEEERELVQR